MIKVAFVRGKYLNNFEGQSYVFPKSRIKLTGISSLFPLNSHFPFPVIKLFSVSDLQIGVFNRVVKILANRTLGDSQILFGLEKYAGQFDIFHTADSHYYYSYQLARLRQAGLIKRLISTSWETIPFNNESVRPKKTMKKFVQNQTDAFICYTEKARECLIKEGISPRKIKMIRLGVDVMRFNDKKNSKKSKNVTVLFVGRPVKEKGIDIVREMIKMLHGQQIKFNIVEAGSVGYEKMSQIYRQADILIMPSKRTKTWEEQYGMVLVEAMASGLPVIAYNSGAIKEILGDAGILVPENSMQKMIESVKYLSEAKELRLKLGRIGRKRAEKYFDARKTAQSLIKIYENLYDYLG